MIKQNKIKAIVSSILILLPTLATLIFWQPLTALLHERLLGESTHGLLFVSLFLPCILLCLHWLMLYVTALEYRKNPQQKKLTRIFFFIIPVISLFVGGLFFAIILGWQIKISMICAVTVGVSMIIISNYIPKSKPNHVMGPRTRWALDDAENWYATCRYAGRIGVGGGVAFLFTGFLPLPAFIPVFFVLVLIVALTPYLYSYLFYKKQVAEGKREEKRYQADKKTKAGVLTTSITLPLVLILCAVLMLTGNITVTVGDTALTVDATYYDAMTLSYDEIASIAYVENDSAVRQYGFGSMRLDLGVYQNAALGTHTRYAYHQCHVAVVITGSNGQILVINGMDEAATKDIYNQLLGKVGAP